MNQRILLGVDTGGTFTDFVLLEEAGIRQCKVLSTPADPSLAIVTGLRQLGVYGASPTIVHGTTVGTNAVLEGKGARVAYVTSEGFTDVLTLGRQDRAEVYELRQPEVPPPVPAELCFGVSSRVTAEAELCSPANVDDLRALRSRLDELAPEAIALNLLFSFLRPAEERRIAEIIGGRRFVSCSSEVLPEAKEYERGVATWLNASIGPVIKRYLERLQTQAPDARISVMQSAATTIVADQAASQAVRLLLSGPAGGLAAALAIGKAAGQDHLLTFDMGGTSTDVSLLDGEITLTDASRIGDYPLAVPSVDMHTIGAGGGSIARVDSGGMLIVGPESAGADPGPACYGRGGTNATVTDANLVLGRIPKDTLLGGTLALDFDAAVDAIDRLAAGMLCTHLDAARGIVRVANEHMARALRVMSVERGHDPKDYSLFCFGGAGGLHACELARLLDMRRIVLPARAGVLSAFGMLVARPGRHLSKAVLHLLDEVTPVDMEQGFAGLAADAVSQMAVEGFDSGALVYRRQLELRYRGQSATHRIDYRPGSDHAEHFHQVHAAACGHRLDQAVELVNLRLEATGPAALDGVEPTTPGPVVNEEEKAVPDRAAGPVRRRDSLRPGDRLQGPVCITETGATAWIERGWEASLDALGNLLLQSGG
jgi:N-methylhydantoinase A